MKRGTSQLKRSPLKAGSGLSGGSGLKRSSNRLKQASAKKKKVISEKIKAYKYIAETRELKCEGCGRTDVPLSHSHLVAESFDHSLAGDPRNIRLHCLDWMDHKSCHEKWENGVKEEVEQMLDFKENMNILKEINEDYYNRKHIQIYGN